MFNPIRNGPEGEHFNLAPSLNHRLAISEHARKCLYFGNPSAIIFLFDLDFEHDQRVTTIRDPVR